MHVPPDESDYAEEQMPIELSKRDARAFMKSLAKPPRANAAARRAARRLRKNCPAKNKNTE
jgi:uncharacterized protein (DUF1778 family)